MKIVAIDIKYNTWSDAIRKTILYFPINRKIVFDTNVTTTARLLVQALRRFINENKQ